MPLLEIVTDVNMNGEIEKIQQEIANNNIPYRYFLFKLMCELGKDLNNKKIVGPIGEVINITILIQKSVESEVCECKEK